MNIRSNEPYWLLRDGLVRSYPSLHENLRCDVAVIGAGITGALMAHALTAAGLSVVVVDRRDVGSGSSSASTAMLQYEIDTPLHKLIPMVGEEIAVGSYRACQDAIKGIGRLSRSIRSQCGFTDKQSLYLGRRRGDVRFLQKEFETRIRHGFDARWLDRDTLRTEFDVDLPAAILTKDAAEISAYRLAHDLLATAVRKGAEVFDHVEIEKTVPHAAGVTLTTDTGSTIEAAHIVYCTGYESQAMLPETVVKLKSTFALVTEPLKQLPRIMDKTLAWDTATPYLYLRTTDDNRILIGGEDEPFKNAQLRDVLIERKAKKLEKSLHTLLPQLDFVTDFTWAGTFGETKDGLPYIGAHPDYPHSFFALGFGGNGITFSWMAANYIRDALLGKAVPELGWYRFGR
jgi:glycine/D-amino acid oxidase-like deaminating enzyme